MLSLASKIIIIPEINYDTRSSFCIYAGFYAAIPFMEVWHGLAPDAPDGRSFPDVRDSTTVRPLVKLTNPTVLYLGL